MLTRHEITKGFSVIAQWQGLRNDAAREIKHDRRYYRLIGRTLHHKRMYGPETLNQLFKRRSTKHTPKQHISADYVAEIIAGKLLFAHAADAADAADAAAAAYAAAYAAADAAEQRQLKKLKEIVRMLEHV